MTRNGAFAAGGLATVALAGVLIARAVAPTVAVEGYLLALGAITLLALARAARTAAPRAPSTLLLAPPQGRGGPHRPRDLERFEREVYLSAGDGFYLHHRLRPILREIAAAQLAGRRGIDLDRDGSARAALGEEAWAFLRADRREPQRWERGLSPRELARIVDAIEAV